MQSILEKVSHKQPLETHDRIFIAVSDFIDNITSYREQLKFPSDEDLNGAAVALTRLQDTYRLDTSSLARGELNGVQYSSELTAADCFELGRQSYNNEDYYHTLLWMREADARLGREVNQTVDRSDILEYLAFSTYKQGIVSEKFNGPFLLSASLLVVFLLDYISISRKYTTGFRSDE